MSRAARKRNDPIKSEVAELPTPERLARGDVEVSGRGKEARARVLGVVENMDSDCRAAAAWILAKTEAAAFMGFKLSRFERFGDGGNVELLPSERGEAARIALRRMGRRIDPDHWQVIEYRLVFDESEENVAIRLGLSRGQVSRRFVRALQAIGRILRRGDR